MILGVKDNIPLEVYFIP